MSRYLILLIKKYLFSPYTYVIFFFPLIILVGLSQLIPISILLSSSLTVGITTAIMILFGGQIQEVRRTSFFKSLSISSVSKTKLLISNFIVSTIFSFIIVSFTISISFVLDKSNLMTHDFSNLLSNSKYSILLNIFDFSINWSEINVLNLIYSILITSIFAYSLTFLIISFVKSNNVMNTVFLVYIVSMILFGGVLIPVPLLILSNSFSQYLYYFVPSYYTNQLITASIISESTSPLISGIIETHPTIGEFLQNMEITQFKDWNWDFIQNDINYINSLFNNTYENTRDLYNDVISHDYESSIFKLLTTDIPVIDSIIKQLIFSNGVGFLPIEESLSNLKSFEDLMQVLVDNKKFLISYQNSTTMWDFSNIGSLAICFGPVLIITTFDIISLKTFKWNVR